MNILIPHTWLLEHLETEATPQQIQEYVSLCGPSIERIYDREGESVYDIEVTTNRVDSMSVRGIARETAVILNQFDVPAQLKELSTPTLPQPKTELPGPTIVNDQNIMHRAAYVVLTNVERTPTPEWMAKRLRQIEQNVHDSVIDITNYITHELGHPCHAFDYDAIMQLGGSIQVQRAQVGETFTIIDGETFETKGGEIVFTNPDGDIIDLPAIKGTANTSISDATKNVLLWFENLPAMDIRVASMNHAIRTVAAQLSEKNVDHNLGIPVLQYGAHLYQELCNATVASELHDYYPNPTQPATVTIPVSRIDTYLGIELEVSTIVSLLEQLECTVSVEDSDGRSTVLAVTPPTFRPDITIPEDIVEEVARIYGYHNLPSTLMDTPIPTSKPTDVNFDIENRIKRSLTARGWNEVYTYSLVSEAEAVSSGHTLEEHLKLSNPLTDDKVFLRRSLAPSLKTVVSNNPTHTRPQIFEIANVYHPQASDLPKEELHVTLMANADYAARRADLEYMLQELFIPKLQVNQTSDTTADLIAHTYNNQQQHIGTVTHDGDVFVFDLIMAELLQAVNTHPEYRAPATTAKIKEDLTFTVPEKTHIGDVVADIQESNELIVTVRHMDTYKNNVTIRMYYQDPEKNLSDADVASVRKHIVSLVAEKHAGKLVGSLA